jgi:putative phosphoribosyl transferase
MNVGDKPPGRIDSEVSIDSGSITLQGRLSVPTHASGVVLFVHGSGSSRHSPRNRFVAAALQSAGIGTLLFDLLTGSEEIVDQRTAALRFDIDLLTERLIGATTWTADQPATRDLPIGYFGASTGAAAALVAAGRLPDCVSVVVSRGGRPDLAGAALSAVQASTLLIVGAVDTQVLALNRLALAKLRCLHKELIVIPGATHLFEEPGALNQVARVAATWFAHYLAPVRFRTKAASR